MSLIRLEDVVPGIPRPGWPGRRRAIARLAVQVVLGTLFLVLLLACVFVYLWLGAPEGAGWPS